MSEQIKVGDTLWCFDENRRVYTKPPEGKLYGTIIYEEHFRPEKIAGETRQSWLIKNHPYADIKVNKETMRSSGRLGTFRWYTDRTKADAVWVRKHRPAIASRVQVAEADQLREIAKIVGYEADA